MKNFLTVSTLLVLALFFSFTTWFVINLRRSPKLFPEAPLPTPIVIADDAAIYQNPSYQYQVSYPSQYEVTAYTPDIIAIGNTDVEGVLNAVAEVRVIQSLPEDVVADLTFAEFAVEKLLPLCAADGPGVSINCTALSEMNPITSNAGVEGYRIMLTQETTNTATQQVSDTTQRGPWFVYPLEDQLNQDQLGFVVIHPPMSLEQIAVNQLVLESMTASFEWTRTPVTQ